MTCKTTSHVPLSLKCFLMILTSFVFYLSAQPADYPIGLKEKLKSINEVIILPIDFDCYYLTSGGIREYNHDMSIKARKLIMDRTSKILLNRSFSISTLPEDSYIEKGWRPLRQFYSVVNWEILRNVYGTLPFPNAVTTFAYSIPPIPDSLLYPKTDAVLFIDGFDDCATKRRLGREGAAAALAAVSVVSMILGGPGVFVSVPQDQTIATCALVDRSGAVIWYYRYSQEGTIDMTTEKDIDVFLSSLLAKLSKGESSE